MTVSAIGVCNVVKKCLFMFLFTAWVAWAASLLNGRLWDPTPQHEVLWGYPFNNTGDIVPLIASNALKLGRIVTIGASDYTHQLTMENVCLILSRNMQPLQWFHACNPDCADNKGRQFGNFVITGGRYCKLSLRLLTVPPVTTKLST